MTNRQDIHDIIDRQLDEWGIGQELPYSWGQLSFTLTFERGKIKLVAKERETSKELVGSYPDSHTAG